jgi:hypothetical protein
MRYLLLVGLLLLGPALSACKTQPETATQRAVDACQNTKESKGPNTDCSR